MLANYLKKGGTVLFCLFLYVLYALYRLGIRYEGAGGNDLVYIFYNIQPLMDIFELDAFILLLFPFLLFIAVTSYYISKYVLSMQWMSMIRRHKRTGWCVENLKNVFILQIVLILCFNLLLYCIFGVFRGFHTSYEQPGNGILPDMAALMVRQIGCFFCFGALQLFLSVQFHQRIAALAIAALLIMNVFLIKLGLFTPFLITFSEKSLGTPSYHLFLVLSPYALLVIVCILTFVFVRKKDFA